MSAKQFDSQWLLDHRHLGPAIIGEEAYKAAQALATETGDGIFGPALLDNGPTAETPELAPKAKSAPKPKAK